MNRLAALLILLAAIFATPTFAAQDWNGTWIGNWQDGDGIQVIVAGNDATGIFWNGDYLPDALHSAVSDGGKALTISWDHGNAILTRTGDDTANIAVHEPGRPDAAFAVKLDK